MVVKVPTGSIGVSVLSVREKNNGGTMNKYDALFYCF